MWQHYIRQKFVLSGNGKESFNPILDPEADPDHHKNLTTSNARFLNRGVTLGLVNPRLVGYPWGKSRGNFCRF